MVAYKAYKPIGVSEGTAAYNIGPYQRAMTMTGPASLDFKDRTALTIVTGNNVTIEYSVSVLHGVTDSMITDLNQADQDGNFTALLSNFTGTPLIVMGTFTKVEMEIKAVISKAGNSPH